MRALKSVSKVTYDEGTASFNRLTPERIGRLKTSYPDSDVDTELLRPAVWLEPKPPTAGTDCLRLIMIWMNNAQERAQARPQTLVHGDLVTTAPLPSTRHQSARERRDAASEAFINDLYGRPRGDFIEA